MKSKKKKPRISTVLFILLLVIGLGVLLYPTISDYYTRWLIQRELSQYEVEIKSESLDYSSLWEDAQRYNWSLMKKASPLQTTEEERAYVSTLLNPLGTGMMGRIEIPKINVELPIYQGTEEAQLQSGAGYWIGSSLPTGGESTHCVITAHTGLTKAKLFTDIDQLEEGDIFIISVLDRVMTYEVDRIRITDPDDLSPLYVVKGKDYVTLYTCYPYGVNTHRLLVRGHRVNLTQAELEARTASPFPWWVLLFIPVLLIIIFLFYRKRRKLQKISRKESFQEGEENK